MIELEFGQYQDIRGALELARGAIQAVAAEKNGRPGLKEIAARLKIATTILEKAREKDEDA